MKFNQNIKELLNEEILNLRVEMEELFKKD